MARRKQVVRIVVDGVFGAGKSTFTESVGWLIPGGVEVQSKSKWRVGVQFPIDKKLDLQICEAPGAGGLTYYQEIILPRIESVLGVIMLCDARESQMVYRRQFQQILAEVVEVYELPVMIAANRMEEYDSLTLAEMRDWFHFPSYWTASQIPPIVPCEAIEPESVQYTLLDFLEYYKEIHAEAMR